MVPVPTKPAPYPLQDFDRANQVGVVAEQEGWYLGYFEEPTAPGSSMKTQAGSGDNIRQVCEQLGKSYDAVSRQPRLRSRRGLPRQHRRPRRRRFGAPSFVVGDELFGATIGSRMPSPSAAPEDQRSDPEGKDRTGRCTCPEP